MMTSLEGPNHQKFNATKTEIMISFRGVSKLEQILLKQCSLKINIFRYTEQKDLSN